MSGAVGSKPAFTRRGLPVFAERSSFRRSSSSGMQSTVPFRSKLICSSIVIAKLQCLRVRGSDGGNVSRVAYRKNGNQNRFLIWKSASNRGLQTGGVLLNNALI